MSNASNIRLYLEELFTKLIKKIKKLYEFSRIRHRTGTLETPFRYD